MIKGKGGFVYILTNKSNSVLYVGVCEDLQVRIGKHKIKEDPKCFTARYNVTKLVYYTFISPIENAIAEEKRIKGGTRAKKMKLVNEMNPEWRELYDDLFA